MSDIAHITSVFDKNLIVENGDFSRHQVSVLRILAVSSSTTSIISSLVGIYFVLAIAPKRLVFRHQLIFFLLFFDLVKSCVLLIYPSRVLTHSLAYYNKNFCQIVGFFTAVSIEGADFAILSFAIHTFLLIFKPSLSVKVSYNNIEGGLYRFRYFVYCFSFVTPIILASLAFIRSSGYEPLYAWCYLPQSPVWYRLVLSWIPRYLMLIAIVVIYVAIYFHVIKEFKLVGGVLSTLHKKNHNSHNYKEYSVFKRFYYYIISWLEYLIPKLFIPVRSDEPKGQDLLELNDSFHEENLKNFQTRQQVINKQIKTIFIYPISYILIWAFPFILQITQYDNKAKPIFWLNCLGAFMQPFNGVVDTLVFLFREKPWEFTPLQIEQTAVENKIDKLNGSFASTALLDSFDSAMILSDQSFVYAKWRHQLSWLKFPLFRLPNEEIMLAYANKYLTENFGKNPEICELSPPIFNIEKYGNSVENESLNSFKFEFPNSIYKSPRVRSSTVDPKSISNQDPYSHVFPPQIIQSPASVTSSPSNSPVTLNQNFSSNNNLNIRSIFQNRNGSANSLHHKKSFVTTIYSTNTNNTTNTNDEEDDSEDFMDFLRRGPPV